MLFKIFELLVFMTTQFLLILLATSKEAFKILKSPRYVTFKVAFSQTILKNIGKSTNFTKTGFTLEYFRDDFRASFT